jgi:hypothetical protein
VNFKRYAPRAKRGERYYNARMCRSGHQQMLRFRVVDVPRAVLRFRERASEAE